MALSIYVRLTTVYMLVFMMPVLCITQCIVDYIYKIMTLSFAVRHVFHSGDVAVGTSRSFIIHSVYTIFLPSNRDFDGQNSGRHVLTQTVSQGPFIETLQGSLESSRSLLIIVCYGHFHSCSVILDTHILGHNEFSMIRREKGKNWPLWVARVNLVYWELNCHFFINCQSFRLSGMM